MQATGASARQLEHWAARGYIPGAGSQHTGSGRPREWSKAQVEFLQMMVDLVDAGFRPDMAAQVAQHLRDGDTVLIGDNIQVVRV
jgi:DNA-binding transcriptional MerR regulator